MELVSLSLQSWAITFLQAISWFLIFHIAHAAIFARPARSASHLWTIVRFLFRIFVILLVLFVVLFLHETKSYLLQANSQAYHSFPEFSSPSTSIPFSSPAGPREQVGPCFNFTSHALDHYQVLALPRDAAQDVIRPAYKTLARACHPDKLRAVSAEAANANFERLQLAYEMLKDEGARCTYECDELFPTFGRTARERARCDECSEIQYLRRLAEEAREDAGLEEEEEEEEEEKKEEEQNHRWDDNNDDDEEILVVHAKRGAVSTFVRAAVKDTSLALGKYAAYALGKARRGYQSLQETAVGQYASHAVGKMRDHVARFYGTPLGQRVLPRVIAVLEKKTRYLEELVLLWSFWRPGKAAS